MSRTCAVGFLGLVLAGVAVGAAAAAPGELDRSFSGDGKKTTRFTGGENYGGDVAVQADGKIVVVGQVLRPSGLQPGKIAVARLNTNGTLDATFGGDGRVTTKITHDADASAVVIQPDGRILVAGRGAGNGGRFLLVRYRRNGRLDRTFSGDGKKFVNFTAGEDYAFALSLQGDGKIVAAGAARVWSNRATFAIARFNNDGSLDSSFSVDGKVRTNFTTKVDQARGLAIQPDGKIVTAGGAAISSHTPGSMFALARYNTDGTLDSSFGADGKLTFSFGGDDEVAHGVAIQADSRIVVAGTGGVDTDFAVARLESDGTPDAGFGTTGQVLTSFTNSWDGASGGLAIQADGDIVAAGHADFHRFALVRYESDGSLDTTFSGDGKVVTRFSCCATAADGVAIQADGNIVAAGDQGEHRSFAVARYRGG